MTNREDDGSTTPLIQSADCNFAYIKRNSLYIVATTKKNSNIAMIFALLHKICSVRKMMLHPFSSHRAPFSLAGI